MKKSVTKIVKATLGLTMAIGAGVGAAGTNNKAVPLNAAAGATPSGTWTPITSVSDINEDDDFLLAYVGSANTYYATGAVSSNELSVDSSISEAKTIQFVAVTGGYNIKISNTHYLNNTSGKTNMTSSTTPSAVWAINTTDLCVENTSNSNRFLGGASDGGNIRAYANSNKNTYPNVHVYKEVFSITYKSGEGTGSDYTVNNIPKGSYTLINFVTSGFTAPSGQRFKCWSIAFTEYNAGASYTVGGATTVTAIYEDIPADPYINLTLNSSLTAFTGQTVSISAEYGNGVAGLAWTVQSGSTSSVVSSDSGYSATIGGSTGTLTIRATDTGSETYDEVSVSVTKVTLSLNKASTSIGVDCSETLTATHNASGVGGVNWSSNNAKVTVENGVVTVASDAVVDSTAIITATSAVDSTVSATCTVTVIPEHGTIESDPLDVTEAVEIGTPLAADTPTTKEYYVEGYVSRIDYPYSGSPATATFWLAKGDNVIRGFEAYRVLLADGQNSSDLKVGAKAIIRCNIQKHGTTIENAADGEVVSLVYAARPAASASLNKSSVSLKVSSTVSLTATVLPVYTTDTLVWTSSNNSVATVSESGVVTAVAPGIANITLTAGEQNATCVVTVCDDIISLANSVNDVVKPTEAESSPNQKVFGDYTLNIRNAYNHKDASTYSYMMFGTKELGTSESLLSNNTPAPGAITKIVFRTTSNSSDSATFNASLSDSEILAPVIDDTHTLTGKGSITITADASDNLRYFAISCTTSGFNGQLDSIEITYDTTIDTIESISTETSFSYDYVKNGENDYTFSNVIINFTGIISKTLWNRLNSESTITGYGFMLSTETVLNGSKLKDHYNDSPANPSIKKYVSAQALPAELDANNYIWNLRKMVAVNNEKLMTNYVAVVYIITEDDGVVFFEEATASVKSLAAAAVATDVYDEESFDGSLNHLANLA